MAIRWENPDNHSAGVVHDTFGCQYLAAAESVCNKCGQYVPVPIDQPATGSDRERAMQAQRSSSRYTPEMIAAIRAEVWEQCAEMAEKADAIAHDACGDNCRGCMATENLYIEMRMKAKANDA